MSSSLTATGLLRSQNSIDLRQPKMDKCINDKVVVLAIQWRLSKLGNGFLDQPQWGPPPWTELQWVTLRNVIELAEDS